MILLVLGWAMALPAAAETISLKRAVELALSHSPSAAQADADEQRAFASYREAKDQYVPQLLVGSGLGDTWGYPLSLEGSAPSLFNVTAQSALFNPALRDYIRAARMDFRATQEEKLDRRSQITQDTVLTYLELVKWQGQIEQLRQQHDNATQMEQLISQRVEAGVDNRQAEMQAQLSTARSELRIAQAQSAMDVLRANLAQLTGIPLSALQVAPESVPALPEIPAQNSDPVSAEQTSPAVMFAQQHAIAQSFRARAEHRSLWPSVDFATQYAVLAKFNNWLQFFSKNQFERNNATVGVVIRFPFFNLSQHAHAQAADAEALRAQKEAESTKEQISERDLKLRRSVEQFQAAQKVSELEYEIAQSDVQAVEIQVKSGTATMDDEAKARADLAEKYNGLQDSNFELTRARINLMRVTGELESWVNQSK
jgi:outer membrane protein TolC